MANSYLTKTLGSPTNNYKWTYSVWVKRSKLGTEQNITEVYSNNQNKGRIMFRTDDQLEILDLQSDAYVMQKKLNRKFRDTNAWYHIVIANDSTIGSPDIKIYVNGVEETSFATDNEYTQNQASLFNSAIANYIGSAQSGVNFDGYMSHFAFVDGTALTPTSFGQTDSTSGIWKFKSPSGVTWGTNGFHLKMENSAALGTDSSGNTNTFTVNGNLKQALDTPSNVYATINSLGYAVSNNWTVANGNTSKASTPTTNAWRSGYGTIGASSGKYYWEFKVDQIESSDPNNIMVGIIDAEKMKHESNNDYFTKQLYAYGYHAQAGNKMTGNGSSSVSSSYGAVYTANDIVGIAMDLDNSKIYFHKNGTYQNSGDPTSGSTGTGSAFTIQSGITYLPAFAQYYGNEHFSINMGNGYFGTTAITSAGSNGNGSLFEYDVPSGYYALNTKNINTYG